MSLEEIFEVKYNNDRCFNFIMKKELFGPQSEDLRSMWGCDGNEDGVETEERQLHVHCCVQTVQTKTN